MTSDAHIDGPPDPDGRPLVSRHGVDLTLIRAELKLTPLERLEALRDEVASLERLRRRDDVLAR